MDQQQARDFIKDTFQNPFDKSGFARFIRELLNSVQVAEFSYQGNFIPDAFKPYVSKLERLGKYHNGDHELDILVVRLKKETSIERARTMQRNFIAWYLKGSRGGKLKDAALAAFVSPNEDDWRFSLVKMDYRFEQGANGKVKVKEEFTPARRWSFLVGKNENSHTAQSRLAPVIADEKDPTLEQLQDAFNIEKVTKEFFETYRDLFLSTKESLDNLVANCSIVHADFTAKNINTVDFAKKLLGQIVFLYFLQKKGWFGIRRDSEWGSGSKKFLRELFERQHGAYNNFFNDILEPLFYEALRMDRGHDDDYYSRFNCKIPFLNGGLFDPINNYDWVHTDVLLPDELFSNTFQNHVGDVGTGILDVFDRYNFTVKEDEPLEKEVAVDPEMLGKAYEKFNAIRPNNFEDYREAMKGDKRGAETKFNREFGVYYTPREIVHYMCQQSLVQYLSTELDGKVAQEDIALFIKSGEHVQENEVRVLAYGRETDTYAFKLPETIRNSAGLINKKLTFITVCDPAVGSGAFPVGMMNEIVKARSLLSPYIDDADQDDRSIYFLKRHCIEHSLYGVDIDPGAIEIAKLRLWLSLVVDEEDIRQIKPLPNLDYKIVCGDSLLGYGYIPRELERVEKLKVEFFDEVKPSRKNELRKEIDDTLHDFFGNTETSLGYQVTMDFRINFSEVFQRKGGFDVVIGNPPYVQIQKFSGQQCQKHWEKQKYKTYLKTGDIYSLFYEKGIDILHHNGALCFITSNKWMRANYGRQTRGFFLQYTNPLQLIDLAGLSVFESVTVDTNILILQKAKNQNNLVGCQMADDFTLSDDISTYLKTHSVKVQTNNDETWIISSSKELSIRQKIARAGTRLKEWDISINRGILTGYNQAFIIDGTTKEELIAADFKNADIIKPILRGRDIKRYKPEFADFWLIATHNGYKDKTGKKIPRIDVEKDYPVIKEYLDRYWSQIVKRQDQGDTPYNLRNCAYMEEFAEEKIVWGNLTLDAQFALVSAGYLVSAPSPIMAPGNKYILAVLNSRLSDYFIRKLGVTRNGGYFEYKPMFVENIPIPKLPESEQQPFVKLVDETIKKKESGEDTGELECQINHLVYKLYGLTNEEIEMVEGTTANASGINN